MLIKGIQGVQENFWNQVISLKDFRMSVRGDKTQVVSDVFFSGLAHCTDCFSGSEVILKGIVAIA